MNCKKNELMKEDKSYWTTRYLEAKTGWDIGYPSTPLKEYIDQLTDTNASILIPGAGNAYEAEYLFQKGFKNVYVLDVSEYPLKQFKERNPTFPATQLICENFFGHQGVYDIVFEQTFFCSMRPTEANREGYSAKMQELLKEDGKLVGLWFDIPLVEGEMEQRPFGGDKELYLKYLLPYFDMLIFEPSNNSIPQRSGNELFGIFRRK